MTEHYVEEFVIEQYYNHQRPSDPQLVILSPSLRILVWYSQYDVTEA